MCKKLQYILVFIILLFSILGVQALPDLTLRSMSVSSTIIKKGEVMTVTFNVENIGNQTSTRCYVGFYISTTPNLSNAIFLSRISLESLQAGGSTGLIQFVYPLPSNVISGTNYVIISIDDLEEIEEDNETNNHFYASNTITVSGTKKTQNLPYPMIFMHGLVGANSSWDSLHNTLQRYYGWSYGGNMNFCLNQDRNTATSNISNDYKDWTNMQSLSPADFYTVNFNTNQSGVTLTDGNNAIQSNQAGIVKQGYAVRDAVKHVLAITGREKVVLVGHSMGGLASREYIQNSSIWQADNQHHVAKLLTIGTPHGGSNATFFGLGGVLGMVDELSEAVRDLRTSYYSGHHGVYLFGGTENSSDISGFISNFCNVDVNCNGVIGNSITGLNQKALPTDLAYTCIVGVGSLLGGDGVVSETSANLKNYYGTSFEADTFVLKQQVPCFGCTWHQELTKQIKGVVQGMDEVNEYQHAYSVSMDQLYFGIISKQSVVGYTYDYDDYKFTKPAGTLNLQVFNIPLPQYNIAILDASFQRVYSIQSNGKSYINKDFDLPAGNYYLEMYGIPADNSWFFPYAFKLHNIKPSGVEDLDELKGFYGYNYPNPFKETTTIAFFLPQTDVVTITIYNLLGQPIATIFHGEATEGENSIEWNGSDYPSGVYIYTIEVKNQRKTYKFTISK